jgi:hypothetical protein
MKDDEHRDSPAAATAALSYWQDPHKEKHHG